MDETFALNIVGVSLGAVKMASHFKSCFLYLMIYLATTVLTKLRVWFKKFNYIRDIVQVALQTL